MAKKDNNNQLILFSPEALEYIQQQLNKSVPGMNTPTTYKLEGIQATRYKLQLKPKRYTQGEMHTMVANKTHLDPITKEVVVDSYKDIGQNGSGAMSGTDPLGEFVVSGVALGGLNALGKTGLWNLAKYAPKTELGNWGRGYFVNNAMKGSLGTFG